VQLSSNGGSTYGSTVTLSPSSGTVSTTTILAHITSTATVGALSGTIAGTSTGAIEQDIGVSGTVFPATAPAITVSTHTLTLPSTTSGTAGNAQTFTVSGINLTGPIVLTAPAGVQLWDIASGYSSSLTLPQSGGVVSPTTIQARIAATASQGPISGSIAAVSTGASEQDIAVSGFVSPSTTPPVHHQPIISSTPGQVAVVGKTYTYQVVATDPDGNAMTYAISDTSGTATITSTGLVSWNPPAAMVGQPDTVKVQVIDPFYTTTQTYGIAVWAADTPPTLQASTFTIMEGQTLDADLNWTDVNPGDSPIFTFASTPPSGLTLNSTTGHLNWAVPANLVTANTNYTVQITASDGAGSSVTATETIVVQKDTTPPVIVLTPPSESVVVNTPVVFQVKTSDAVAITSLTLGNIPAGPSITLNGNGQGLYTPTATGTLTFTATAVDANGNTASTTTTLTIVNPPPPNSALPVVTLAGVSGIVTQPTALSGTVATTSTSGNIASWLLEYSSDGKTWYTETSATGLSWTGTTTITPTFDPTSLQNGIYTLRLSATSVNGYTSLYAYTKVTVGGALKVGTLTVTVTDLSLNVAGIPVTFSRTYNSANAGQLEDFGYGWKLNIQSYALSVDTASLDPFGGFQSGSRLYIKDSSGIIEGYTFAPIADGSFGGANLPEYLPYFAPDANDTDSIVVDQTNLLLSPDGGQTFLTAEGFTYTMGQIGTINVKKPGSSGLTYQINANTGQTVDEFDTRGNQLVFDGSDIRVQRLDANGNYDDVYRPDNTQEIIPIVRDGLGRITAITDLRGNSMNYTYDANGNLLNVIDRSGHVTATYGYNGQGPHYLTSIADATGAQQLQAQYDPTTHRVTGMTSANGSGATVSYTVAAPGQSISSNPAERAIQTTTSTDINPITGLSKSLTEVEALDANGNVIRTVDDAGFTTTINYNAENQPISQTKFFGTLNLTTTIAYSSVTHLPTTIVSPTSATYIGYDANTGGPISITDGDGHATGLTYDPTSGNLLSTNAGGVMSTFGYDSNGQMTSATTAGATTTYTYDQSGDLTSSTDELGNLTSNTYDDNANLTGTSELWVDPNNSSNRRTLTTNTVYDGDDRDIQETDQQGLTSKTVYDTRGNVAQTIDPHGNVTTTTYDIHNKPIEVQYPDGTVATTLYDSLGNVLYQSDPFPAGTTNFSQVYGTETIYDAAGRVIDSERVTGLHVIVTVDPNGMGTATYDPTSAVSVVSAKQTSYRSSDGQVDYIIDPDGAYVYPQYDSLGRHTGTVVGSAPLTFPLTPAEAPLVLQYASTTQFDADGRVISVTDPSGQTTATQYDGNGRVIEVTSPDGSYTQAHYNGNGQMDYQIDAMGNRTDYAYDASGRLITVTQPAVINASSQSVRPVTTYGYDQYGDQTSITDANGHVTTFTYDAFGHQLTETLPGGATETSTYNSFGDLDTQTDFDGNVTKYIYDYEQTGGTMLGRLMEVDYYPAGFNTIQTEVTYHYDALGRQDKVIETTNGGAPRETDTIYDAQGNVTSVSSPEGTINYTYNAATGLETSVSTSQSETDFGYDAMGRLQTVTESKRAGVVLSTPTVSTYAYDSNTGNTLSLTITSGSNTLETTLYGYDSTRHWLKSVTNEDGSSNILSSFTYTRRADGQITQESESVSQPGGSVVTGTTNYQYDALDRLTQEAYSGSVSGTSFTANYTLDLVGNRLSETVTGAGAETVTDTYNARDELLTETTANGTTTTTAFGYDPNGSQTTTTTNGVLQQTQVYDAQGRLVQVKNGSGAVEETVLYTAAGNRASVTQSGVTTNYIVDDQSVTGYSEVLEEYQGGVLVNSYIYGNSLDPVSQNTSAGGSGLSSVLLLSDGHSGVRQAYMPGSGIIMAQRFDAFGNAVAKVTVSGNPFTTVIGYRGQRFDTGLGQYYMRARLYDPVSGRFTAMDPDANTYEDPLQLMRYGYAGDNPVNAGDPSGNEFLIDVMIAMAIQLSLHIPTLVQGALITTSLLTFGSAGSALRERGLELMSEGNMDEGYALYQLGTVFLGIGLWTAEWTADAIDEFIGAISVAQLAFAGTGNRRGSGGGGSDWEPGGGYESGGGSHWGHESHFAQRRRGSGRNEPHGRPAGAALENQLKKLKKDLQDLKAAQGDAREAARIERKIKNIMKKIDRKEKGETHHMR
jgi:RHS repeat-associated protein